MDNSRKVTEDEVKKLYVFTRQHFVEHFDIQTELVDHLASAIEDIWKKDPSFSFDEALATSFKKFGIFGFSDVVESRTNALSKKYYKKILSHTLERLRWPKIISSLSFAIVMYYIVVLFNYSKYPIAIAYLVLAIFSFIKLYRFNKYWKQKTKGIRLMSIELSIKSPGWILYIGQFIFFNISYLGNGFNSDSWYLVVLVFLFSLFTFTMYDSIYSLEEDITDSYNKYLVISS